jgi:hypothetical protein
MSLHRSGGSIAIPGFIGIECGLRHRAAKAGLKLLYHTPDGYYKRTERKNRAADEAPAGAKLRTTALLCVLKTTRTFSGRPPSLRGASAILAAQLHKRTDRFFPRSCSAHESIASHPFRLL